MSRGPGKSLNWGVAEAMAYRQLLSSKRARTGTGGVVDQFPLDSYWADPLQNAVVRTLSLWRAGTEELPATTEELAAVLVRRARHNDDNRRGKTRRRRDMLTDAVAHDDGKLLDFDTSWTISLFRAVTARDLFSKLVARLYEVMDDEGRAVLDAWLRSGIALSDTRALMRATGIRDVQRMHNVKRRLKYRAGLLLAELGCDWEAGGHS